MPVPSSTAPTHLIHIIPSFTDTYAMARLSLVAAMALSGGVSAFQIPLQLPFQSPWTTDPIKVPADTGKHLPLVDTEALQALISAEELEKRSKTLYEIAKKGEEEYGHPTRVIGGKGKLLD